MSKFLISLALVAAQVLPYAGGPWFACVSRDGSVCVDRGPHFCCCVTEANHDHDACGDDHDASCEPAESTKTILFLESYSSPAPCDCTHELLDQEPTTVTRDAPFAVDLHVQMWAVASLDQATVTTLTAVVVAAYAGARIGSVFSQGLHNSVVLRC